MTTGALKAEPAAVQEISGLIRSGAVRLADAKNHDLSLESRFDLAYNAAHALSLAALQIAGYRSKNRYLVFQYVKHTLNIPNEEWRVLDQAHRKSNLAECEGSIGVDENIVEALIRVTGEVERRILESQGIQYLTGDHPWGNTFRSKMYEIALLQPSPAPRIASPS